jgi:DinB superfamily
MSGSREANKIMQGRFTHIAQSGFITQTAHLIRVVRDARFRILGQVGRLSEQQAAFKPAQDCWSVSEILEHLVLAELAGVSRVWTAAVGVKSNHPVWTGESINAGLSIEEVIARTWKEKEVAPAVVTPHIGGPLAYWVEAFNLGQPLLESLGRFLQGMDLTTIIYPHTVSGPLDAGQRIEFLQFHMDRHRGQIEKLLNRPDFPRA